MSDSRLSTIRELLRPPLVKIIGLLWIGLTTWDVLSSQFDWPNLRSVWGMTGSLLPWWGWLLVLQAIFVYALFEYVRTSLVVAPADLALAQLAAPPVRPRIPDITLFEVAQRVIASFGPPTENEAERAKIIREAALQIGDRVKQHKLTVWARRGERPLEKLSSHEWATGDLILGASQIIVPGEWSSLTYNDVQFESDELNAVWPPRPDANV